MKNNRLENLLKDNKYPGRGIVIGKTQDACKTFVAYFIMGRSENSRNRIFVQEGDNMRTQAFDESKLVDPSLIIYFPVRTIGKSTIVTNGDQTDTINEFMLKGDSFENALRTRCFEPDVPNYTPRISGLVLENGDYKLSILKSANGDPASSERYFYEYENPIAGYGHFIHTYECDGDPIPSFEGEPQLVEIVGTIDQFTSNVWNSLNRDNRVSLFTRSIDLKTGKIETRIINKNK